MLSRTGPRGNAGSSRSVARYTLRALRSARIPHSATEVCGCGEVLRTARVALRLNAARNAQALRVATRSLLRVHHQRVLSGRACRIARDGLPQLVDP